MTRERLKQLDIQSLEQFAEKIGLEIEDGLDPDGIIELIIDAVEEDRVDRDEMNNLAIRIEEKKFAISRDEEIEVFDSSDVPLPEHYNETSIVLMLRDPFWAFAYWEIKETKVRELKQDPSFDVLFLKVVMIEGGDSFEIPIQFSDRKWYINLPVQKMTYRVELRYVRDGKDIMLAVSNTVYAPAGSPAGETDDVFVDSARTEVMTVSSFDIAGKEGNPQRILSPDDAQYV